MPGDPTLAPLVTVGDLLAALPAWLRAEARDCGPDTPIGRPRTDSRAVESGDCFVAIPGLSVDGHRFLDSAVAAGAGLLVVLRDRPLTGGHPRIVVTDTAAAVPILAAGWHGWPGEHMWLAGVTGTNGKTTTAHLVGSILRAAGRLHLRLGTTGNWLVDHEAPSNFTTPFPVEFQQLLADARERGATCGVMEVSSHALAQDRAAPLRFRAVALTSFSQDHLDFHASMADYLAAKCRLAREHCLKSGVAIAPVGQGEAAAAFVRAAAKAGVERVWRCSRTPSREAEIAVVERREGLHARARTPAGELELRSPMVGEYNLDNLLVATGLALGLGVELEQVEAGLATATGAPGRLELVDIVAGGVAARGVAQPAVYVDYAHTPDAVARALEALRPIADRRGGALVVLLGCGGDRDASKRPLMGAVASRGADRFYATSDNPRTEPPEAIVDQMLAGVPATGGAALIREVDRGRAIARAIAEADARDVLLIAGKGHEDYQILGTTKIHFDDREHAEQALRARG